MKLLVCSSKLLPYQALVSNSTGKDIDNLTLFAGWGTQSVVVLLDVMPCCQMTCRDKPAIASDGEKISAYYNIACCLSRTGNIHDGLLALLEALQMGYEDFDQLRQDPDLEAIRADSKFEPLMSRFQKVNRQNILQSFIGNLKNPLQR